MCLRPRSGWCTTLHRHPNWEKAKFLGQSMTKSGPSITNCLLSCCCTFHVGQPLWDKIAWTSSKRPFRCRVVGESISLEQVQELLWGVSDLFIVWWNVPRIQLPCGNSQMMLGQTSDVHLIVLFLVSPPPVLYSFGIHWGYPFAPFLNTGLDPFLHICWRIWGIQTKYYE